MEKAQENQGKENPLGIAQVVETLINYIIKEGGRIVPLISEIEELKEYIQKGDLGSHNRGKPTPPNPYILTGKITSLEVEMKETGISLPLGSIKGSMFELYKSIYGEEVIKKQEEVLLKEAMDYAREGSRVFMEEGIKIIQKLRDFRGETLSKEEEERIWDVYKNEGIPYILKSLNTEMEKVRKVRKDLNEENAESAWSKLLNVEERFKDIGFEKVRGTLPEKVKEEIEELSKEIEKYKKKIGIYLESQALKGIIENIKKYLESKNEAYLAFPVIKNIKQAREIAKERGKPLPEKVFERIGSTYLSSINEEVKNKKFND